MGVFPVLTLGYKPLDLVVILNSNTNYWAVLQAAGAPFPDGTTVTLLFDVSDTPWTATVTSDTITFDIDSDTVNMLIVLEPKSADLYYSTTDRPVLWARGRVDVND
jgi:hypothetical protein